jgi:hypothetical protein
MSNDKPAKAQDVIKNLDEDFDGNSAKALEKLQHAADTAVQPKEFYEQLLGPDLYEFYFGGAVSEDINALMADCIDKTKWEALFEKFKNGKISAEDMAEVVMISHVQAVERSNPVSSPEEIIDRAFESKVKGKLGRKLISATINALSENNLLTAPKEAVTALIGYNLAKTDARAESNEEAKKILLPATLETAQGRKLKDSVDQAYEKFTDSLNIADNVRDISYDELLTRLADELDPYFGITHQIAFDIGWESISRLRPELGKCLAVYVAELDKAWTDTVASNMKQSDRHMTRYLVRDVAKSDTEKLDVIQNAFVAKYKKRFTDKTGFIKVLWDRENQTN